MDGMIDELKYRLLQASVDGKITCEKALAIANEIGEDTRKVAGLLNEMGIKIIHCQLGCFP